MKKKIFILLLTAALILPCAGAYDKDSYFFVHVNADNIPENTKYIDMLVPLKYADGDYISLNTEYAEKCNISENSEIVHYTDDGFCSYTFHMKNAYAYIIPEHYVEMNISSEQYEYQKDNITTFNVVKNEDGSATISNWIPAYDDFTEIMYDYAEIFECDISEQLDFAYTSYLDGDAADAEKAFSDFCNRYKEARFAYIDENGNVLAVTNAVYLEDDEIVIDGEIALLYDGEDLLTDSMSADMSLWDYLVEAAESEGMTEDFLVSYLSLLAISILSGIVEGILYGLALSFVVFYILRRDRQKRSVYLYNLIMNMK